VAKATGVPLVKVAARLMAGSAERSVADTTLGVLRTEGLLRDPVGGGHVAVKEAVLPFNRFPEADAVLGPEMRSTGEVMGIDRSYGMAFAKSQLAAGTRLPSSGTVFLSLADRDKPVGVEAGRILHELGFRIVATTGTAAALEAAGVPVVQVTAKVGDADGVDAVDLIAAGSISLVVNSPRGRGSRADGAHIRRAAGEHRVPLVTTGAAALAAARGLVEWAGQSLAVRTLQEFHQGGPDDQPSLPL